MTIFDENSLVSHLRTRDCVRWLHARMENKQTSHLHDLYERRLVEAEMVAAEVYHALVWFLRAYPQIASVKPIWVPEIDPDDGGILVRFRLDLESRDPRDQQEKQARLATRGGDPLERLYGYGEYPPSIEAADLSAYDTLIELGEGVGPPIWNEFVSYTLADRKRPAYTNTAQVEADLAADLSGFLPHLQQWLLERGTAPAADTPRPGPRL